ncbi:MAG: ERF family protein [Thermodesulfobium sp.]
METNFIKDFIELQKELNEVSFKRTKAGYGYKYTPLEEILPKIVSLANNHNFAILQNYDYEQSLSLITCELLLIHTSGEVKQFVSHMPVANETEGRNHKNIAQEVGATITYLRRYQLITVFGIATEEDTDAVIPRQTQTQDQPKAQALPLEKVVKFIEGFGLSYKQENKTVIITSDYNSVKPKASELYKLGFRYDSKLKAYTINVT